MNVCRVHLDKVGPLCSLTTWLVCSLAEEKLWEGKKMRETKVSGERFKWLKCMP